MTCANKTLVKFLKDDNLLDGSFELEKFNTRHKPLLQALSDNNEISQSKVFPSITKYLGISQFTEDLLDSVDIKNTLDLMKQSNYKKCSENHFLPVETVSGSTYLLLTNPFDIETINEIRFILNKEFEVHLISGELLNSLLCRCDPNDSHEYDEFSNIEFGAQLEIISFADEELSNYDANDLKTPAISLVNKIIIDAISSKASDIHLEPNQWSLEVRNRIDGTLHRVLEIPKRLQKAVIARIKLLSNMDIAEHRKPQDGRLQLRINGLVTDLRVSCIPTSQGECLVLRVLQTNKKNLQLENLNIPQNVKSKLLKAISAEGKLLLVTGPTGSGKTTTLYSCLTELLKSSPNIVTVEDPIEYRFAGVNQMQVNELAGVTFASSLRSIMRQDPDIILIGEIRDNETADIAIQAAQTGHLVLSTLHTNDAPSAITRLADLGVEPFLIASSLAGVIAQRLVRKICPHCSSLLNTEKIKQISNDENLIHYKIPYHKIRYGNGCNKCRDTGYFGRVGIYSYLEFTKEIAETMQKDLNLNRIVNVAESQGFTDIDEQAIKMVVDGITTIDEVLPYLRCNSQNQEKKLKTSQIGVLSDSDRVKEMLISTINSNKNLIGVEINPLHPKFDLSICIIDDSISQDIIKLYFSLLEESKISTPILILGNKEDFSTFNYSGEIKSISKNNSPLAIINKSLTIINKI